jgi:predicted CoA-binding protein
MQIAIGAKTVAVLGCKTESQASQPAFFVAQYLQSVGINLIPVPGQHGPQTCS